MAVGSSDLDFRASIVQQMKAIVAYVMTVNAYCASQVARVLSAVDASGTIRREVEVLQHLRPNYFALGLAPCEDKLAVLAYPPIAGNSDADVDAAAAAATAATDQDAATATGIPTGNAKPCIGEHAKASSSLTGDGKQHEQEGRVSASTSSDAPPSGSKAQRRIFAKQDKEAAAGESGASTTSSDPSNSKTSSSEPPAAGILNSADGQEADARVSESASTSGAGHLNQQQQQQQQQSHLKSSTKPASTPTKGMGPSSSAANQRAGSLPPSSPSKPRNAVDFQLPPGFEPCPKLLLVTPGGELLAAAALDELLPQPPPAAAYRPHDFALLFSCSTPVPVHRESVPASSPIGTPSSRAAAHDGTPKSSNGTPKNRANATFLSATPPNGISPSLSSTLSPASQPQAAKGHHRSSSSLGGGGSIGSPARDHSTPEHTSGLRSSLLRDSSASAVASPAASAAAIAQQESVVFILSPKALLSAQSRDAESRVQWLLQRKRFGQALEVTNSDPLLPAKVYEQASFKLYNRGKIPL